MATLARNAARGLYFHCFITRRRFSSVNSPYGASFVFRQLLDSETSTYTYLLGDPATKEAVIIDAVKEKVERDLKIIEELGLRLVLALETHVHADHITGAGLLRKKTGCKIVLSKFGPACADIHVTEGDTVKFGKRSLAVLSTPGHTDTCVSYVTDDKAIVFTGDALLIRSCGRTDFQQGSSERLWNSVREKLFKLPDHTLVFPAHDYLGRMASSIGEEKQFNPRLNMNRTKEEFFEIMANLKLKPPAKIQEAVEANMKCGCTTA